MGRHPGEVDQLRVPAPDGEGHEEQELRRNQEGQVQSRGGGGGGGGRGGCFEVRKISMNGHNSKRRYTVRRYN